MMEARYKMPGAKKQTKNNRKIRPKKNNQYLEIDLKMEITQFFQKNGFSPENKKQIKKILQSKDPQSYIDQSVKSALPGHIKGKITKIWLKQNPFTSKDIEYARNRHPYWKQKKQMNHQQRTKQRFEDFNFSSGKEKKSWSAEELIDFVELNSVKTDRELAQHFSRSIPSIQGIRRRINLANKILQKSKIKRINKKMLHKYIVKDEKVLRKILQEM